MNQYFEVVKFKEFQHFKDRDPIWIKLYRSLLDDYEFNQMPESDQITLVKLWLYAAKTKNKIPNDPAFVQAAIHSVEPPDLKRFMKLGWLADIKSVSSCHQLDSLEKRREEKRRGREETTLAPPPKPQAVKPDDAVLEFPTIGELEKWYATKPYVNELFELYGKSFDVLQEMKVARAWIRADMTRRKTVRGMKRFLGSWMERTANKGTGQPPKKPGQVRAEAERMKRAAEADKEQKKRHERSGNGKDRGGAVQAAGDILKGDPNAGDAGLHSDPKTVGQQETPPAATE